MAENQEQDKALRIPVVLDQLRAEITEAIEKGKGQDIQFQLTGIDRVKPSARITAITS